MAIVRVMMQRDPSDDVAYWLQLGVAMSIATLGLVVEGQCCTSPNRESRAPSSRRVGGASAKRASA